MKLTKKGLKLVVNYNRLAKLSKTLALEKMNVSASKFKVVDIPQCTSYKMHIF